MVTTASMYVAELKSDNRQKRKPPNVRIPTSEDD